MSTPLFLLLGLTVATCVIAYWSDNLGKKLGKKRISLFNLRPRQTATLITMASSVVIMLLTLAVLLGFNRSLRESLLRYDALKANSIRVRQDNVRLSQANEDLEKRQTKLAADIEQSRKRLEEAGRAATRANAKLASTQTELHDAQRKVSVAEKAVTGARRAEKIARGNETSAQRSASLAQRKLAREQRALSRVNQQLATAQTRLTTTKTRLATTTTQLARTTTQYKMASARAAKASARAWKSGAELVAQQARLAEQQAKVEELRKLRDEQETVVHDLVATRGQLEQNIANLGIVAAQIATDQVAVIPGQVFAERMVLAHSKQQEILPLLHSLLAEGNKAVASSGRTLQLAPVEKSVGNQKVKVEGAEIPVHFANYLSTSDVPVSVRLVATRYFAASEDVILATLVPLRVRRVFARGEVIAATTIDGNQGDAEIFRQLLALVDARGAEVARQRGLAPVLAPEENLYAGDTRERIFEALRRIQSGGGPSAVRLVAADDISTVDQLRVKIEVESNSVAQSPGLS